MAKSGVIPDRQAWDKIVTQVRRLESELRNLRSRRLNARPVSAGQRIIEFQLRAEMRRGDTKKAIHVPWGDEANIGEIDVTERYKLSAEMRAPATTRGYAVSTPAGWIVLTLDCDALEPHDGDEPEESEQ